MTTPTGRFAPAPTGPLHFGSLVTALASYLDARSLGGRWLVRIEDIDHPRVVPGAADAILDSLHRLGLHWDGEVLCQASRRARYERVLDALLAQTAVYPCGCTRAEVGAGKPYPGTCRSGLRPGRAARAWRLRVAPGLMSFTDRIQGEYTQDLEREVGDFIVRRADALVAYHLAVVTDDADQGVTHVVRGADLMDSTPRQIWLQRALGLPQPQYAHVPLACDAGGRKLSKQNGAPAISPNSGRALYAALKFLGQRPPVLLAGAPAEECLAWGLEHWRLDQIPRRVAQPAPAEFG